jgi:hypothetical protein
VILRFVAFPGLSSGAFRYNHPRHVAY